MISRAGIAICAVLWCVTAPVTALPAATAVASAELALARGDWPRAARDYAAAARDSDDVPLAERATRVAYDNYQYAAAAAAASRWLALAPAADQEVPRRYLATALLRSWQLDAATLQFEELLRAAYADRPRGYGALLDVLLDEPDEVAAARIIERLAAADATVAEAQYARCVLWNRADNGERALAAAREAVRLRPGWLQAQLAEARALLALDRTEEGLALARTLAESGEPYAALSHAWFLIAADRHAEARGVLERLQQQHAGVPEVLEALGVIDFEQKNYDAALGRFGEMLRTARAADSGFWYVGVIAEKQGDRRLAARSLARVTGGGRAVNAQVRAQQLLADAGAPEEAAALLEDFLAAHPQQAPALVGAQATHLADRGQGAAALALVRRARQFYPGDPQLANAEAVILERLDRVDESLRLLRSLLAERPGDPTLQNSLGYTLADRTTRVAEGHALIRDALAQKPDNFAIIDSMGWSLHRLGRTAEAVPYLERAWSRSHDPEVAWHLGDVYAALGRRDEAMALLAAAAADEPDNRHVRRLRGRLEP